MNNQSEQNTSPTVPSAVTRARRSQAEWAALMTEWEQSGQSQKAFCEVKGLCYRNFNQWKSRLKKNTKTQPAALSATSHEFIRVGMEPDDPLACHRLSKVTVQMPSDITLTLACDIDSVLTLIHGLRTSSC